MTNPRVAYRGQETGGVLKLSCVSASLFPSPRLSPRRRRRIAFSFWAEASVARTSGAPHQHERLDAALPLLRGEGWGEGNGGSLAPAHFNFKQNLNP